MADQLFRFPCVRCAARLKAQPVFAGKSIVCPKCKTRQFIPQPASSEEEVDLSSAELQKLEMFPPAGANRPPVGPPLVSMPPLPTASAGADPRTAADLTVKSGSSKSHPPVNAPPPVPAQKLKPTPLKQPPPPPESAPSHKPIAADPALQSPPLPISEVEAEELAKEALEILDLDNVKTATEPAATDQEVDWFEIIDD